MLISQKSGAHEHMSGKIFKNTWIIDSGTTNHMTGNRERFSSPQNIAGVNIGLPDGDQIVASMEGSVKSDTNLTLNNVLFMPKLQ